MEEKKYKYQSEYENAKGCFWIPEPAKFVKLFAQKISLDFRGCKVLDLGAGEGKNAVYLASLGANVTAIEISPIALSKFKMQPNYDSSYHNIVKIQSSILDVSFNSNEFDIIMAYGVLHALSSKAEIFAMINNVKEWTKVGGYFICATFTDRLPPPSIQDYLERDLFLRENELQNMFSDWKILFSEDEIITETHPTSNKSHQHSIVRMIARKHE